MDKIIAPETHYVLCPHCLSYKIGDLFSEELKDMKEDDWNITDCPNCGIEVKIEKQLGVFIITLI